MELLGYHSNLNSLWVLDDESPTTKSRHEKGGFINSLEPVQGESHQGLLDWHLRRRWDIYVHLEFGDHFLVGKVAVRDLFVLVYNRPWPIHRCKAQKDSLHISVDIFRNQRAGRVKCWDSSCARNHQKIISITTNWDSSVSYYQNLPDLRPFSSTRTKNWWLSCSLW
jgi:hypothetical protein